MASPTPGPVTTPTSTAVLPTPVLHLTRVPDPQQTAQAFLDAWKAEDYATMYGMLTQLSQDAISQEDFEKRYRSVAVNTTLKALDYRITQSLATTPNAQVAYRVIFHTNLLKDIERDTVMNLAYSQGAWKVQWEEAMIIPELARGEPVSAGL